MSEERKMSAKEEYAAARKRVGERINEIDGLIANHEDWIRTLKKERAELLPLLGDPR